MLRARFRPRGVKTLSFENEKDGERRRKAPSGGDNASAKSAQRAKKGDGPEVGSALRSVYDATLNESIPPEMLDLLGKLG